MLSADVKLADIFKKYSVNNNNNVAPNYVSIYISMHMTAQTSVLGVPSRLIGLQPNTALGKYTAFLPTTYNYKLVFRQSSC